MNKATESIRSQFPQLSSKVYGKPLVYLDNAATSLRPQSVLGKWNAMSAEHNSNLHRAVHRTANDATALYEAARDSVREFIGASQREQIVFTSGATASLNLVAFSFGEAFVGRGDEILVSESGHHSNIVPWQMLCERKGAVLKVLPVTEQGFIDIQKLPALLTERTKICCIDHVSNVLGLVNPVRQIADICHSAGCKLLVDGAQGIVHTKVDFNALGCDFYAFSGHKMYAAPGTGVLCGTMEMLNAIPPYMGGGEMIQTVKWSGTSYAPVPQKFEAGTQNISGTPTFVEAIAAAREMCSPEVSAAAEEVKEFVYRSLLAVPGLRLYGTTKDLSLKVPVFSFTVEGAHHEDLALILDKMGVAVRSGQMCAEPLMDRFGTTGMLRASFAPYNTMEEAQYFIQSLERAVKMLK